jgi:Raf kinase inhibitor-like YbhB/YbcL family protein
VLALSAGTTGSCALWAEGLPGCARPDWQAIYQRRERRSWVNGFAACPTTNVDVKNWRARPRILDARGRKMPRHAAERRSAFPKLPAADAWGAVARPSREVFALRMFCVGRATGTDSHRPRGDCLAAPHRVNRRRSMTPVQCRRSSFVRYGMYRQSLSNAFGGSLLVAIVAVLHACGSDAGPGGNGTPSGGTTGTTPTGAAAGTTGVAIAGRGAGSAGTSVAAAGRAGSGTTTSGVSTAGTSGAAGARAGAPGSSAAATGGTSAAAGNSSAAAGATGGAAGTGVGTAGSTGGGALGGPLMYTGSFTMGMTIPPKHKCPMDFLNEAGENKSPPLSWTGGPADTKSFAVVLYDTQYMMLHWAIWDIPATVNMLPEGLPSGYELTNPAGAHQAAQMGDDDHAYYGPCSSGGAAGTYEYRLYALKVDKLGLMESSTAAQAQTAIESMMLEKAVWTGKPM